MKISRSNLRKIILSEIKRMNEVNNDDATQVGGSDVPDYQKVRNKMQLSQELGVGFSKSDEESIKQFIQTLPALTVKFNTSGKLMFDSDDNIDIPETTLASVMVKAKHSGAGYPYDRFSYEPGIFKATFDGTKEELESVASELGLQINFDI